MCHLYNQVMHVWGLNTPEVKTGRSHVPYLSYITRSRTVGLYETKKKLVLEGKGDEGEEGVEEEMEEKESGGRGRQGGNYWG